MLNQTAQAELVFQALAIPSRRFIVDRLSSGPASVSELARPLRISLAAVVQHLRVLEDCGIVRSEKAGRVPHWRGRAGGVAGCRAVDEPAARNAGEPAGPARLLPRRSTRRD